MELDNLGVSGVIPVQRCPNCGSNMSGPFFFCHCCGTLAMIYGSDAADYDVDADAGCWCC